MVAVLVITDSDAHFLVITHGAWLLFERFLMARYHLWREVWLSNGYGFYLSWGWGPQPLGVFNLPSHCNLKKSLLKLSSLTLLNFLLFGHFNVNKELKTSFSKKQYNEFFLK